MNGDRYLKMLEKYYVPALRKIKEVRKTTFQQDGAPPHIKREVLIFLRKFFGKRLISRSCDMFWPAYSPDLNPCDFYLWGYLKSKVYLDPPPETLQDLKKRIKSEIKKITATSLKKVCENFANRLQKVKANRGGWIEHTINN